MHKQLSYCCVPSTKRLYFQTNIFLSKLQKRILKFISNLLFRFTTLHFLSDL